MYCSKCGSLLKESDKFCSKCGAKINKPESNVASDSSSKAKDLFEEISKERTRDNRSSKKEKQQPQNKKFKHPFLMAFVIINVIIACGIGIFRPDLYEKWDKEREGYAIEQNKEVIIPAELNSTIEYDDMEYTVKDYSFENTMGGLSGLREATEGNCFLVLHVDVKNISNSTKDVNDTYFYVLYDGDIKYMGVFTDYSDFYNSNDSIIALGSLNNKILNFEVPFEVRDSDKKIQLVLRKNTWNTNESVIWDLN